MTAYDRLDHVQFDFSTKIVIDALSCVTEPLSNLSTWNNMYKYHQISTSLAKASRVADARLTIYTGGHFGVVMNHAGEAGHQPRCVSTWVQRWFNCAGGSRDGTLLSRALGRRCPRHTKGGENAIDHGEGRDAGTECDMNVT